MDLARSTVEQQQALVEEEAYRCGANAIPLELHVSLHEIRIGATLDDSRIMTREEVPRMRESIFR